MATLILDRSWRFQTLPPFLGHETSRPGWARTAGFLAMALPAAVLTGALTGLLISLAAAGALSSGSHLPLTDALGLLANSARSPRSLISYAYELSVAGLATYAAALVVLWIASRVYRRPVLSFLTASARFRWRIVGAGLAVGLPLMAIALLAGGSGDTAAVTPPILTPGAGALQRLGYAACALVMLYLAALAEEAVFRGWLLQQTAAWTRSLPLILGVNGVLFSLAHFDPNPVNLLVRAIMGAGWAWIALRTAGVEFTTGAHLANNLFVALFVAPVSFTAPKARPFDLRPALVELAIVAALAVAVEVRIRGRSRKATA